jgi:CRP/FNR family transcriptional regulator
VAVSELDVQGGVERFPPELLQIEKFHEKLQSIGAPMEAPRGFLLYHAGEVPDSCYLIQSGQIVSTEVLPSGRELVFSINEEGEVMLLPAIILHRSLTLDFRASVRSKLVRIKKEDLLGAMNSDPDFLADVLYYMTARYSLLLNRFQATSRMAPWNVCNLLLSLAEKYGEDHDGKVLIRKKYSQQRMADFLHANRTTVARVMKELSDLGLVERINDYYCIRDMDGLRRHMSEMENLP